MTVVLRKAPVVYDPDEAEALLEPYYEREDESAFAPSADLVRMSTELLGRHPPWSRDDADRELDPPSLGEYARVLGIGTIGVLLVLAGWMVSIPVLSWIVIAVGGFVAIVAAFLLVVSVRRSLFGAPVD